MSKLDELRQHGGSFPGALYNILAEFDARITALETHKPMLDSLKTEYDAHVARQQADAEQPEQETPATPAPATPAPATPAPNPQGATS